jgi:hypothetical protein
MYGSDFTSMPLHAFTHHEFQLGHYWHLQEVLGTRTLEKMGRALLRGPVRRNAGAWLAFSHDVCRWGGKTGARVFGRISKNDKALIETSFTAAKAALRRGPSALMAAKRALSPIQGLGSFSYASKHLRMLDPAISPVLDGIVDKFLVGKSVRSAQTSIEGRFLSYADFCQRKALQLRAGNVKLGDFLTRSDLGVLRTSRRPRECSWTAGDVDMACFALIRGWVRSHPVGSAGSARSGSKQQGLPPRSPTKSAVLRSASLMNTNRPPVYLSQHHQNDTAVTIKEACGLRWNLAWICRDHGSLDFKRQGARGTTRYLIGEILDQGVSVTQDPRWVVSLHSQTCHHDGGGYLGGLRRMGTVADAVRYLKRFFDVRACSANTIETQDWIDAL